ncbi:MAG: DUF3854 domain-containing protein [Bacillota bacterium]
MPDIRLDLLLSQAVPAPNGELRVDCPFCGDRAKHLYVNPEKGLYHCFRCGRGGRVDGGRAAPPAVRAVSGSSSAPVEQVAAAYEELLRQLGLCAEHMAHLTSPVRGLSEAEVGARGYRTLPATGRTAVAERVGCRVSLRGVPGFYVVPSGKWCLAGPPGILVPVRNFEGKVWGVQVRRDAAGDGPRYVWLSSAGKEGGAPARARYHVACPDVSARQGSRRVWLTEGPLKADIAASRLGEVVVAVPGVGCWKGTGVVHDLRRARVREVVIAFDSDVRTNPNVARALGELVPVLAEWFRVRVAVWDPGCKGIDDALLAGKALRVLTPEQYWRLVPAA